MRLGDLRDRWEDEWATRRLRARVARLEAEIAGRTGSNAGPPVVFFDASTRIHRLSLNAAFGLLTSWRVRLDGAPIVRVVCRQGLPQCPLGTQRGRLEAGPPCRHCIRFSDAVFPPESQVSLDQADTDPDATRPLGAMDLAGLTGWSWRDLPLGRLVLPSVRWALRRHDLEDSPEVRGLVRRYLSGAVSVARRFDKVVAELRPRGLVVFNGIMYPEAVAREVARRGGVPVVTHEVGLRPYSAFFSHNEATFRQVRPDFNRPVDAAGSERLDRYLQERFQGRFSMAGVRFWPTMTPVPEPLRQRLEADGRPVVVFTNVVFDTSQVHANHLFGSMFEWLEDLRRGILRHPERLFVLRAHPDESRPGKESQQSVEGWVRSTGLAGLPNVVFLPPAARVSSYALIRRADVVLVYNSSIGLEAAILGRPVLCAGRARYSEAGAATTAESLPEYRRLLEMVLSGAGAAATPQQAESARRFLDFELHRASLDFAPFLRERPRRPGMVVLKDFGADDLAGSRDLSVVARGILDGEPFFLPEADPAQPDGYNRTPPRKEGS